MNYSIGLVILLLYSSLVWSQFTETDLFVMNNDPVSYSNILNDKRMLGEDLGFLNATNIIHAQQGFVPGPFQMQLYHLRVPVS